MLGNDNTKDSQEIKRMLKVTLKRSTIGRPKDQRDVYKRQTITGVLYADDLGHI